MVARLLIGIVKGLIVGGLLGFAVAKLGFAAPGALVAYPAAVLCGIVIGLVAGKPIWAKDARIEAGTKAVVGALLAAGLMWAIRRWLTVPFPISAGELTDAGPGTVGTIGGLAIPSLALIAALLGGFYEADNTPEPADADAEGDKALPAGAKRIASGDVEHEADDEADALPERTRGRK